VGGQLQPASEDDDVTLLSSDVTSRMRGDAVEGCINASFEPDDVDDIFT